MNSPPPPPAVDCEDPSRSRYVRGCRCSGCTDAHRTYQRAWRARRKEAGLASWFSSRGHTEKRPRGTLRGQDRP